MTRTAKPIPNNAKELKDEATDKELSAEIVKSGKPAKRLGGRWNKGFEQRNEIERPLAPRGGGKAEAEHVFRPGNVGKDEEYRGRATLSWPASTSAPMGWFRAGVSDASPRMAS